MKSNHPCIFACFGLPLALLTAAAHAGNERSDCSEALVLSTYNRVDTSASDARLGLFVTEHEYDEIKHSAGANATIYGIPMGASYSDYRNTVHDKALSFNESLTQSQATNVMWTGLDPQSGGDYQACLKAKVFSEPGLHLAVVAATKSEVVVVARWTPVGNHAVVKPTWGWGGTDKPKFPVNLTAGQKPIHIARPTETQTLSADWQGWQDTIYVEPFPAPPTPAKYTSVITTETYKSDEAVGWGSNWSTPVLLCTPEKPAGWKIEAISAFTLESKTERNSCNGWVHCTGGNQDTATRACRTIAVQGHNENRFDGYGKAIAHMTVIWSHPERQQ